MVKADLKDNLDKTAHLEEMLVLDMLDMPFFNAKNLPICDSAISMRNKARLVMLCRHSLFQIYLINNCLSQPRARGHETFGSCEQLSSQ